MQLVHATWEQRNLGLNVYEADVTVDDTRENLGLEINAIPQADYTSIKLPAGQVDLTSLIEACGFGFREMLTTVEVTTLPALDGPMARLGKAVTSHLATAAEREAVYHVIRQGLFETDRFSLDPRFTLAQSSNRYCGWIGDELARGGELHALEFKGQLCGFFLVRKLDESRYASLLAALFPKFQHVGLGYFINYMAYAYCFEKGAKRVATTYSSNNVGAANIHAHLSTRLLSQVYVYAKHG
ncbi:MAG: hypothetical protein AAF862_11865 [Pseudomonadota bacterium]